jgi:L,D-peptidoglycan transpeptidase YkuD (ErfK/YbiS/YcfS/YnhG family)
MAGSHKGSKRRERTVLEVRPKPGGRNRGVLRLGARHWPCVLGHGTLASLKREGDGATPLGTWELRQVLFRPDRMTRPATGLPLRPLQPRDGWCDDPADRHYNRLVRLPYPASAERLWRDDHLYDLIVVLGYNDLPRIRGRGSAIFMHLADPGGAHTEGCIALPPGDLRDVIKRCGPGSAIRISP